MEKFKRYLIPVFVILLTLGSLFFVSAVKAEQPAFTETNVSGWAWFGLTDSTATPHLGWVSMNCYNSFTDTIQSNCSDSQYGLRIDPVSGDFSGYIWNGLDLDNDGAAEAGAGWINFDPPGFPADPQYSARVELLGDYQGQISGWARIKSLKEEGENLGFDDWGWIHLGPEPAQTRTYGVEIDFQDCQDDLCPLNGYAWAGGDLTDNTDGLGWIFFGDDNNNDQLAYYNIKTNEISGWAWIGNNTDVPNKWTNIGWIALNCENGGQDGKDICDQANFKIIINSVSGDFENNSYAWVGSGFDTDNADSLGWIDFNPNPFPDEPDYPAKVFLTQEEADKDLYGDYLAGDIVGWARMEMLYDYGKELGLVDWGWIKLHKTKTSGDTSDFGLAVDFGEEIGEGGRIGGRCYGATCEDGATRGEFTTKGYGWSGGGTTPSGYSQDVGFGWIMFDAESRGLGPRYVSPFFAVEGGSIYAKGDIGSEATFTPPAKKLGEASYWYNATYMIVSGGTITHFCSAEGGENAASCSSASGYIEPEIDDSFSAPLYKNEYTNALGKIDVDGLVPQSINPGDRNVKNKYGHLVDVYAGGQKASEILDEPGGTWADGANLNGKIYYIQGDLIIDKPLTFRAGISGYLNGAGLIIVDGNLNINENTDYESDESVIIDNIVKLPVVGWIVRGDININGSVTNTVGVYISVGIDDSTGGKIKTGQSENQLVVSGAMIAKGFEFQRTSIGALDDIKPAEKIINDGRAGANTPPGLRDFSLAFPIIRQTVPVEIE